MPSQPFIRVSSSPDQFFYHSAHYPVWSGWLLQRTWWRSSHLQQPLIITNRGIFVKSLGNTCDRTRTKRNRKWGSLWGSTHVTIFTPCQFFLMVTFAMDWPLLFFHRFERSQAFFTYVYLPLNTLTRARNLLTASRENQIGQSFIAALWCTYIQL